MWMRWAVIACSAVLFLSIVMMMSVDESTNSLSTPVFKPIILDERPSSALKIQSQEPQILISDVSKTRESMENTLPIQEQYQTPLEKGMESLNETSLSKEQDPVSEKDETINNDPSVQGNNETASESDWSENTSKSDDRYGEGTFKGAKRRGFVRKQGMIPAAYFTLATKSTRKQSWEEWFSSYVNGNLVSHAPLPFPYCQVYVNHHYKFIWIKGHKVGSTAMRGPLGWLCGDGWRVPKEANFTYCSKPLFNSNKTTSSIKNWWKEYFVFGVVRNPYTRFASAEEYIGGMVAGSCGNKPSFSMVCRDLYLHAKICHSRHCCFDGADQHHYRHFTDQATCLFTDTLLPAVDFIAEVENLDEDFDTIIDEINKRRDPILPPLVNHLTKKNVHGRRLEAEESYAYRLFKQNPMCFPSVTRFYHKEFLLFNYEVLNNVH